MPAYSCADLQQIAAAVEIDFARVGAHAKRFEAAALHYRLSNGLFEPGRSPQPAGKPSTRARKLQAIGKAARSFSAKLSAEAPRQDRFEASRLRVLKALGIIDQAEADDGPGDQDIFDVLTFPDWSSRPYVVTLVRRLAATPSSPDTLAAAADLERLVEQAAKDNSEIGDLTVPKGHHGDRAINGWIDDMIGAYRAITGKEPSTAVDPSSGVAGGRLIRFLAAAAGPIGIRDRDGNAFGEDAWRSRIRTVLS